MFSGGSSKGGPPFLFIRCLSNPQKCPKIGIMNKLLKLIIFLLVISALLANFYTFFFLKNYNFIVESSCNPEVEVCYGRDCSDSSECPPNNLEIYKVYSISAKDFDKCSDDSCKNECTNGLIMCKEIVCGSSSEDSCIGKSIE